MSLDLFQKKIDFYFKDISLLEQALTHSSYAKQYKKQGILHNERLEFFGDAVLKLIVSEYLYQKHPKSQEGKLTKIRAHLVSDRFLVRFSSMIGLGDYMRFSTGEKKTGGSNRPSNLSNAFEALLGAVYLDQGFDAARTFFMRLFLPLEDELTKDDYADHKSELQEWMQKKFNTLPVYELLKEGGPEHQKRFFVQVSVTVDDILLMAQGEGDSKKSAQQHAAKKMFEQLKSNPSK